MKMPASVVELLQELVRIPSVNPGGEPGTEATGEAACAKYVGAFLRQAGARVEIEAVFPRTAAAGNRYTTPAMMAVMGR